MLNKRHEIHPDYTKRSSRSGKGVANIREVVPENAPFVVYFHSDGGSVGNGFQVNAAYS